VCRALRVLCAAPGREALLALKRAVVSVEYELVGGATSAEEMVDQVRDQVPDVLVLDASFVSPERIDAVRALRPGLQVVAVGAGAEGADVAVTAEAEAKAAVLALPRPGGPVR
jgi:DNA-binding NarL/FixJ family response regulator